MLRPQSASMRSFRHSVARGQRSRGPYSFGASNTALRLPPGKAQRPLVIIRLTSKPALSGTNLVIREVLLLGMRVSLEARAVGGLWWTWSYKGFRARTRPCASNQPIRPFSRTR